MLPLEIQIIKERFLVGQQCCGTTHKFERDTLGARRGVGKKLMPIEIIYISESKQLHAMKTGVRNGQ